jgi:hypothetical protein
LYILSSLFILSGIILLNPRLTTSLEQLSKKIRSQKPYDIYLRPTLT